MAKRKISGEVLVPDSKSATDDSESDCLSDEDLPEGIERAKINKVIATLFVSSLFLMLDNGYMPACTLTFKEEMQLSNSYFGFIGSAVFMGQAVGSFIASSVLQKVSPKYALAFCLCLNIASLVLFTMTENYAVLIIMRALTGFV